MDRKEPGIFQVKINEKRKIKEMRMTIFMKHGRDLIIL